MVVDIMNIEDSVIGDLFLKKIDRTLNGVIKVDQDDKEVVVVELDEYVVTKESIKHIDEFFEKYGQSINSPTDEMGVWVSGFFGSGKSHFIKILSYLLENKEIEGKTPIDYFHEKIKDPQIMATIDNAVKTGSKDVILFNIDAKANTINGQNEKIVNVFLRAFNEMRGYFGDVFWIADMEEDMDEKGLFTKFKQEFKRINGQEWESKRDAYSFEQESIISALVACNYQNEDSARNFFEADGVSYTLTPERFAEKVKKYCKSKGENHQIIFLVDEIGQYIGDNSPLMLNLQTVVEELGTKLRGKAWVVVTSQADIESTIKDMKKTNMKQYDFSKIQGRFKTRLSLSSANVDEVIKRRLLEKKDEYVEPLAAYYAEKNIVLKNLLTFTQSGPEMKTFKTEDDFVDVYPFVPYHFRLLQKALDHIRKTGYAGKHLAKGERSMLSAFKESGEFHRQQKLGFLVPFYSFYKPIKSFLDPIIPRTIDQSRDNDNLQDFDCEILKTLFLVRHVKLKTNIDNLTILCLTSIDEDKKALREKITRSLDRLERETLIHKSGDIYLFLTNEEQRINKEIKSTDIDEHKILDDIWEEIFGHDGIVKDSMVPYRFKKYVDERGGRSIEAELTLKFLTSQSEDYFSSDMQKVIDGSGEFVSDIDTTDMLLIILHDNGCIGQIKNYQKIDKYLTQNVTAQNENEIQRILLEKRQEMEKLKTSSMELLANGIREARVFVHGKEAKIETKNPKERIKEGLQKLIDNVFSKNNYVTFEYDTQDDVLTVLKADDLEKFGGGKSDTNKLALNEIRNYVNNKNQLNQKIVLSDLINRFSGKPYGWKPNTIAGLVAFLFVSEEIKLRYQTEQLYSDKEEIAKYLTTKREQEKIVIELRERINAETISKIKGILRDQFDRTDVPEKESDIFQFVKQMLLEVKEQIIVFEDKYEEEPRFPGKDAVEPYKQLLIRFLSKNDPSSLFSELADSEEELTAAKKNVEPVLSFFTSKQVEIFRRVVKKIDRFNRSSQYLTDDNKKSIVKIIDILATEEPYTLIKELPQLEGNVEKAITKELESLKAKVIEKLERALADITSEMKKHNDLSDTFIDELKRPFEEIRNTTGQASELSLIESQLNRINEILKSQFNKISDELKRIADEKGVVLKEKPTTLFSVPDQFKYSKVIETEDDLDEYIKQLRERLKKLLENKKIKVL